MPETFGRYTLLSRIGIGGMAEVWKGQVLGPAGFAKTLAVKRILPDLAVDASFVEMFVDEAKLVADLVHPNIVQVFELGRQGRDYFIAMEYVQGGNLASLLNRLSLREEKLDPSIALYIAFEAAKALGCAHTKTDSSGRLLKLVHRDISPHNILLSYGGDVKVTDFGIAKSAFAVPRTATGIVRGKLAYLSPEQAGGREVDRRSDLFSLGLVLYEMVTGKKVMLGGSETQSILKAAGFVGLSDAQLQLVPESCRSVLYRVLRGNPDERFQTALELEAALSAALGPKGATVSRTELAALMQRHFADEFDRESKESAGDEMHKTLARTASGENEFADLDATRTRMASLPPEPEPLAPKRSIARPVMVAGILVVLMVGGGFLVGRIQGPGSAASPATPVPSLTQAVASTEPPATLAPTPEETRVVVATPHHPHPTRAPHPAATTAVAMATPPPTTPPATPAKPPATIYISAKPWVTISIDGKMVATETPLHNYQVPSGAHTFTFENKAERFSMTRTIVLPAQKETHIHVDVAAGTITY